MFSLLSLGINFPVTSHKESWFLAVKGHWTFFCSQVRVDSWIELFPFYLTGLLVDQRRSILSYSKVQGNILGWQDLLRWKSILKQINTLIWSIVTTFASPKGCFWSAFHSLYFLAFIMNDMLGLKSLEHKKMALSNPVVAFGSWKTWYCLGRLHILR